MSAVAGLTVVNLGSGTPAALVAKFFGDLGATVWSVDPADGDPFAGSFPAYDLWRAATRRATPDQVAELLAAADVCVLGGEDHPEITRPRTAGELTREYPRLVVLDITGYGGAGPDVPAVETLVQARSGFSFEMFSDRPVVYGFQPGVYGAALLGLAGVWAALVERARSGRGQTVATSLLRGLALFFPTLWLTAERPDAIFENTYPRDVRQLIFECADGRYVQFVLGVRGALAKLYGLLGIDVEVDPDDPGRPDLSRGPKDYFGHVDLIAPAVAKFDRDDLLERLWAAGLGAEPVLDPGECWADEQIAGSGLLREHDGLRSVGAPLIVRRVPAGEPAAPAAGPHPLSGYRVLDFGTFVAGPMGARFLADLGAEVIRVQSTGSLDTPSSWRTGLVSNRGKRSVRVNLKTDAGREIAARLCASADAVTHNFRVGVAPRLGIDPATLHAATPGLVTLQSSAYGQTGPKAGNTGFDMIMQGMSGLERRCGGESGAPLWARSSLVDYATAALGAVGMMIGLYERAVTGGGAEVEADLARTAIYLMSDVVQHGAAAPESGVRLNAAQNGFHPAERLYRTADGWIAVAARSTGMAAALAGALGLDLGPRGTWAGPAERRLEDAFATLTAAGALAALRAAGVWCEPVVEDGWPVLREDPAARASGFVIEVDDPAYGRISGPFGALVTFGRSASVADPALAGPAPGAHTLPVLRELGFSDEELGRLLGDVIL